MTGWTRWQEPADSRLREGPPMSWAPRQERAWMREHSGSDFDEERRVTDRTDAPKCVIWRGHELVRQPILTNGGNKCRGFENRVSLAPPEPCPFYWVTIECDGGRASISLDLEMESASFEGKGKNEIEALNNAAASFEKFMQAMGDLVGRGESDGK